MSKRFRHSAPAILQFATVLLAASPSLAAWQNGYAFGATLKGDLYTPAKLGTPPAILVAIHYCTGNSGVTHSWFQSAADTNGFYIISPDAGKQCFDSSASRNGDKAAIVKMVDTVVQLGGDKNRVFAAGLSSGGCMTNTLLAIYPDVFAGGAAMPGFPAGGWPSGDTTCTKCSSSPPNNTAQQWGDIARNAFAFSGTRPCVQQWVGGGDEYNFHGWLPAVAAQFQNLGNLSSGTPGTGAPSGWTRTVYKDSAGNVRLETNLGPASQKHDLSGAGLFGNVISFLGLDKPTGACGITGSTGTGGAGGATGTGGTTSIATGGTSSTGGSKAAGGTASSTGGTKATSTTATGGAPSTTSGKTTGGAPSSVGGTTGTGGTTSGVGNSTGGTKATGSTNNGLGGTNATSSSSGSNPTGGTTSNSTASSSNPTGGTATNSTDTSKGGATATTSSGEPSVGGSTVGSTTISPPDAGGCACKVAGTSRASRTWLGLTLLGLVLARARRRHRGAV